MKIISLFSGAGGMDLGFQNAGFEVIGANEYDKTIWATHEKNFPQCVLYKDSILNVDPKDIPECDGIVGGPPCQSFSEAGAKRGTQDKRGLLFWDYIRILKEKKPKFFVAENVPGLLAPRHQGDLNGFINAFKDAGYTLSYQIYNAQDYGVAQTRQRLIFVGIEKSLGKEFIAPPRLDACVSLKDVLQGLGEPMACRSGKSHHLVNSHEYMTGSFSSMYMSRNRVRGWGEPSFTILATARQIPIHPQAPKMTKIDTDKFIFVDSAKELYRRLSVRECARIQGFPDSHMFEYEKIEDGYKMIGNAVPVDLAQAVAQQIKSLL